MAKQAKNNPTPRACGLETFNLSRKKDSVDILKTKYNNLQNRPWGKSSIVEGYYFIAFIEQMECHVASREQGLAIACWKQDESDYFNTEIIAGFLVGAFYNKFSSGPAIKMKSLVGKIIHVIKVESYLKDDKRIYFIEWALAEEISYIPDDVLMDAFYLSDEDRSISYDENLENDILQSDTTLGELIGE